MALTRARAKRFGRMARRSALALTAAGAAVVAATGATLLAPTAAAAANRFVFANSSAYDTLDPHVVFDIGRVASRINMYDGLMRWLDNPPELHHWLAESHTISDDGLVYTFKLHPGAKFHDGSEITADDVVYSIERILALGKGASSLFAPIIQPGSTKAVDEHTVEFHLNEPSAIFMAVVPEIHIVNADLVRQHEKDGDWGAAWLASNEAGSGSFMLDRYDPARGFTAKRFPDHFYGWEEGKYLDEIDFRVVLEVNSRVLGLRRGDFNGTDGYLPQDQIKQLREADNVTVHEQESMRIFYGMIHNGRSPMSDVNFRKALNYAFDYDGFINDILSGSVARDPVPLPNNIWGAPDDVEGYSYDLEKAKEHLDKVEEPLRPIKIGVMIGYDQSEQAAALLQNGLNKLGVQTELVSDPFPVVSNKMRDKEQMYDVLFLWRSTYYADPNNWVGEMYSTANIGTRNNSWYSRPEVDERLEEALVITDQDRRAKLYEEAARMVVEDAAGIFVYNTKWYGPYSANLKGVRFCPIGDGQDMRWAYYGEG